MPRGNGQGKFIDRNAQVLSRAVQSLHQSGKLRLPRKGYLLRMTRGKLIVAPLDQSYEDASLRFTAQRR
jgi:hypothetical protein